MDNSDNVWIAHGDNELDPDRVANTIGHLRTDGTWVGNIPLIISNIERPQPGPTGVAIDSNQKVWVTNRHRNNAMRINPNAGPYSGQNNQWRIGEVDLVVDLGDNVLHSSGREAGPYTLSDMTGFVTLGATYPSGSWIFVHDGGGPGKNWTKVAWSNYVPSETGMTVEARAADKVTDLPGTPAQPRLFTQVSNDIPFSGVSGRHLEIRVTLWRNPGITATPILYGLTVRCPQ